MRTLILLSLAAVLALAPLSAAQVPGVPGGPTPTYTVTITNAPTELAGLEANATVQAPFTVSLELGNVVCTADVVIPITLGATATGAPPNVAFRVEPSVINITISSGPHASPPAGGSGDANLIAVVTGNITANGTASITLSAEAPAPAGAPQGCAGAGSIGSATATPAVVNATFTATPQPPPPEPPAEDTPFVGVVAILAVAAVVALARRKKD